jgi:hypothetical protein
MHSSDLFTEIQAARWVGYTRCGVIDGRLGIIETARAFALAGDETIYRTIERQEADRIAIHTLHVGLAYGGIIMDRATATNLWQKFMDLFQGDDVRFATNAHSEGNHVTSWRPATQATFDTGVLVMGTTKVGCLWIEEED